MGTVECTGEEGPEDDNTDIARKVIALLKEHRAVLEKGGLDVDFMIRELEACIQEVEDSEARMEGLKRQILKDLSSDLVKEPPIPMAPTDHLDMAAPELRKDEDVVKHFQRLRGRLRRLDSLAYGTPAHRSEN